MAIKEFTFPTTGITVQDQALLLAMDEFLLPLYWNQPKLGQVEISGERFNLLPPFSGENSGRAGDAPVVSNVTTYQVNG
ncbi:MAG: hypothetical protein EXR62_14635 [Chloroflexi bacterium]|nr:hypothetical protein [Chloroflexota bacterium]